MEEINITPKLLQAAFWNDIVDDFPSQVGNLSAIIMNRTSKPQPSVSGHLSAPSVS